ncbi:Leucine-rich repeat extensin-like protein 2 [Ananas comosus]|uniref:Cell wall hydroxyproline-rich glycoprotein n=1 Tax=Ananas comosus TaxID=4615 RepID=A0A199UXP5_ANACO|nr:Leucine-rich repeat extensin-like protein 2 [Ananas comosus]
MELPGSRARSVATTTAMFFAATLLLLIISAASASASASVEPPASWSFPNARLRAAYVALQTWKQTAIFSDPRNLTGGWSGPDVCSYFGVFCAALPSDPSLTVVAGVDLNHADLAGFLPDELFLGLPDLALFHLNSNRFCGTLPRALAGLALLHELDLSNNRFVGAFPGVVLDLPALRYLDLRFNEFEGPIPAGLFDRPLDAIFLNSNRLRRPIPANLGDSPASVVVLAHNRLGGCIPPSIGRMADTLNEIVLLDDGLAACVPPEVGLLRRLTVFDVSFNLLQGPLPSALSGAADLEQLDVAHNRLTGAVPEAVCALPRLENFTYAYNFFTSRPPACPPAMDGRFNCIPGQPSPRPPGQCAAAAAHPFDCTKSDCSRHHYPYPVPFPPAPPAHEWRRGYIPPPAPVGGPTRGNLRRPPPPAANSHTTPPAFPATTPPPPSSAYQPGHRMPLPPYHPTPSPSSPAGSSPPPGSPTAPSYQTPPPPKGHDGGLPFAGCHSRRLSAFPMRLRRRRPFPTTESFLP